MSTNETVRAIFCQVMEVLPENLPGGSVTPDTIAEWDSLKHLNLVLALEDEFGIEFDEDEIQDLLSLDAFVAAIENNKR